MTFRLLGWWIAGVTCSMYCCSIGSAPADAAPPRQLADINPQEGFATSVDGVKVHYVTAGSGPLVVLIHGFADFWYTWRYQMPTWSDSYQVVAIDLRGYNRSGQPEGVQHYAIDRLLADIDAIQRHFGRRQSILVGHDWGGFLAWEFAMRYPRKVSRLIVLNSPHPQAMLRELRKGDMAQRAAQVRESFTGDEALLHWTPRRLASWVQDPLAKQRYVDAFQRSSIEGILNHYKAHYADPLASRYRRHEQVTVQCPVLMIHGLQDRKIPPAAFHENWQWVAEELTVISYRHAGHHVHHDAPHAVSQRVLQWLDPPPTEAVPRSEPPSATAPGRTTRRPRPFDPRRRE